MARIHPSAIVSEAASIGDNVDIGAWCIIEAGVEIGAGCTIEPYCHLGMKSGLARHDRLVIGRDSLIRSYSLFYIGSSFGDRLTTGHRVTVRENTRAGLNLQLGTLCDVQGDCVIGDYVRCHSHAQINQKSQIGNFVWLFPHVVLTNDPHPPSNLLIGVIIEDFAAVAARSVVLPGVTIGRGALVGAATLVRSDVPPDTICVGNPGRVIGDTSRIMLRDSGRPAYPWRRHFHRGYPDDAVARWKAEFPDG